MLWGTSGAGIPGSSPGGVDGAPVVVGPGTVVDVPGAASGAAVDIGAAVVGTAAAELLAVTERLAPADPLQPAARTTPASAIARSRRSTISAHAKGCVSMRPGAPHILGRRRSRAPDVGRGLDPVKIVTLPS